MKAKVVVILEMNPEEVRNLRVELSNVPIENLGKVMRRLLEELDAVSEEG